MAAVAEPAQPANALMITAADKSKADTSPPDEERLQGTWLLASENRGNTTEKPSLGRASWARFQDGELVITDSNDNIRSATYALDAKAQPKAIDFKQDGPPPGRRLGIYHFEHDTLWICLADANRARPRALAADDPGQTLFHYRRVNAFEKGVLAGDSPADAWVTEGGAKFGWEVRLPFSATSEDKHGVERRFLRLKSNLYYFCRSYFAEGSRLEDAIGALDPALGKVVAKAETKMSSGLRVFDVTLQGGARVHRVRLVPVNDSLYELRVGTSKTFAAGPDAQRFLDSFRLVDLESEIPGFAKALRSHDRSRRQAAIKALKNLDWRKLPRSESARQAIPELIKVFDGEGPAPADENSSIRRLVLDLFRKMEGNAEAAVPTLLTTLWDEDRSIRLSSFQALKTVAPRWTSSEIVRASLPEFGKALSAPDGETSSFVRQSLSDLGPDAKGAVPGLLHVLSTAPREYHRRDAAELLGSIGARDPAVISGLVGALADRERIVRKHASESLHKLGPDVIPELARAAGRDGTEGRDWALLTLGQFGGEAKAVLPVIARALQDKDYFVRSTAAHTLGKIGPDAASTVPALIIATEDEQGPVRRAAAEALGRIGPDAREALPALQRMSERDERLGGSEIARKAIALIRGG